MFQASRLEIIMNPEIIRGKWIITGFHGLGYIGYLTSRFLVETALDEGNGKRVGFALSRFMPPFCEVSNGVCKLPYEFYEIGNAVVLFIRMQTILEEQYLMADAITELAKQNDAKGFVLLGGIDIGAFHEEEPSIVYVHNKPFESVLQDFKLNIKKAPNGIVVSGGIALFLAYAEYRNIPAIALFAPTKRGIQDFKGAAELAITVTNLLNLPINPDRIREKMRKRLAEAEVEAKIRRKIEQLAQRERENVEDVSQLFT